MAYTNSWAFPSIFDVSRNKVSIISDAKSVVNRSRLLILTEPTELFNSPNFGVGLKQHLFKYNTSNEVAIIQDRIKDQLYIHEPYVKSEETSFADGLLFTGDPYSNLSAQDFNRLKMTVGLVCTFGEKVEVDVTNG